GIPFAVAGGVLALWIAALNFSISAAIGFVLLLGISVMNGILLLTYYNEVLQDGAMSSMDGMFRAASQRMRPMLMTALSACIGLLPAAISTGIGSQVQRPLAMWSSGACSLVLSCCSWLCRRCAWYSSGGVKMKEGGTTNEGIRLSVCRACSEHGNGGCWTG